jgi:tetratricopeptide (TPR) repeat protein
MECLDDDAIAAYVDGALLGDDVARIDAHVASCATCRRDLSAVAMTLMHTSPAAGDAIELRPGDMVGRYVVASEYARGGMGIVSIALDPDLDRHVAIKMLQADLSSQLLRDEARAMAKLDHPNVVSVFDVGEHAGRIYFAMELVEGVTLRRWLAHEKRGWRAVLRTCIQAGRGLAAAHRVGLVHRDFKPDNVLCGPDERVRVTDFGLASNLPGAARLGVGSGLAGTPPYIAPELWRGESASARSDQWAFSATLYEALFGTPPFVGATHEEIRAAILAGELEVPSTVPASVRRAIVRGLASSPEERFASVDELLVQLEAGGRRPVARWIALAGVVVAASAGGAVYATQRQADPCAMPDSLISPAWNDERASAITAAFGASERTHATESARRVGDIFDRYRTKWLAARTEACVATRVRGDQSEALLDARVRCLDRRRTELAELVRVLGDQPEPKVIDRAIQVANEELARIDTCSAAGVQAEMPLPRDPMRAAQITALESEVATLRASLTLVTNTRAATERARDIVRRVAPLDFPPLTARAAITLARLGAYSTSHEETEKILYDALLATAAAKDDRATAEIWTYLVTFTANTKRDLAGALKLFKPAEAALARVESSGAMRAQLHHAQAVPLAMSGDYEAARAALETARTEATDAIDRAAIDAVQCHVEQRLSKFPDAKALCERAAATYERELGPHHPDLAFALTAVALLAFEMRDDKVARAAFERSLAILENTVGEQHVAYAMALSNLGMIDRREGKHDAARRAFERAITSLEKIGHPGVLSPLGNLGELEFQLGNYAAAKELVERARDVAIKTYGDDSVQVSKALYTLGSIAHEVGDLDAAERHFAQSLALTSKKFGEQNASTADALYGLGLVLSTRGDCKRAMTYQTRAVAAFEAVYGENSDSVADTLTVLASCQLHENDRAAITTLERSLAIRTGLGPQDPFQAGWTRWLAAQSLWRFGGDRARAIVLAKEGRALYEQHPDVAARTAVVVEIDKWLATRDR